MSRKFKYLGAIPLVLTLAFVTSIVTSCNNVEEGTLIGIEVTSLPTVTEYAVGSSFRRSGLEVTASYQGGETKILASSDYEITTPDMSIVGESEVLITYTEEDITVSTSFTITIYENEIVYIEISDEFTYGIGTNMDELYVPVYASYEDGTYTMLSQTEYDIDTDLSGTVLSPAVTSVTATLKSNPAIYDTIRTFRYEAEDAVATGDIRQGTVHNIDCAWTSDGNNLYLGSLTFNFTVRDAGTYDLNVYATNNYVFNTAASTSPDYLEDGSGHYYDQKDLALNTIMDLEVNGEEVEIEDTAVHNLGLRVDGLVYYLGEGGYQLIRLGNVNLNQGQNTVVLTLHESTLGQINRWGYSASVNLDYLRIDGADPKEIVAIEVAEEPENVTYLPNDTFDTTGLELRAIYDDGSTGSIITNFAVSEPDMSTLGTKTVTVTYNGLETSFEILVSAPESIRIDESWSLNYGEDLSLLEVPVIGSFSNGNELELDSSTYNVVARQNGEVVTGSSEFGTYEIYVEFIADTSINYSQEYSVTQFTYEAEDFEGTNIPSVTNNYDRQYYEFNMTNNGDIEVDFPTLTLTSGDYILSMNMNNLYVTGSYLTQDFDLSKIMTIVVDNQELEWSNSLIVDGGVNLAAMADVVSLDNSIDVNLATLNLSEGSHTISIQFTEDEEQLNRWSQCSIIVNAFYLTPSN